MCNVLGAVAGDGDGAACVERDYGVWVLVRPWRALVT
jgi:hypothetical protein